MAALSRRLERYSACRRPVDCRPRWPPPPAAGELRNSTGAAKTKGGIPWNDSPKMPAPVPFQLPPNPLAGPTPAPRVDRVPEACHPSTTPRASQTGTGGPAPGGDLTVPELRPDRPGRLRVLRRLRHAHRLRASGPQRSASVQPRTMFMGRRAAAAPAVGAARAAHPDPPRRLRGRLAPDSRRRQPDRPRPGAAVRRGRLPVAAPRRAIDRSRRRHDPRPSEPERRVPEDRRAKRRWNRATSSASVRSCCASR